MYGSTRPCNFLNFVAYNLGILYVTVKSTPPGWRSAAVVASVIPRPSHPNICRLQY